MEDSKGVAEPRVQLAVLLAASDTLACESFDWSFMSLERDAMDRF